MIAGIEIKPKLPPDFRLGRFKVSDHFRCHWDELIPFLADVAVMTVIRDPYERCVTEYIGFSKHFDIINQGEIAPEYSPTCTRADDGSVTCKFERMAE